MSSLSITVDDLTSRDRVIQLGVAPLRIDIMTSIEGVEFEKAYENSTKITYWGIKNVFFISYNDLVKNKKTIGREKDLEDLKWLRKYSKRKED